MQLTVKHNFPAIQAMLPTLRKDVGTKAQASAMNKVMALAKTAMSREIRSEFNISAAKVSASLVVKRARATLDQLHLQASLESPRKRGRSLNLINFIERSVTLAQRRKRAKAGTQRQLFVQIKRSGGRKPLGSAFIGNKGRTVFVRVGKSRLPIKALQTIDVAGMFNAKRINSKIVRLVVDRYPDLFAHEAQYFTDRFNAKS